MHGNLQVANLAANRPVTPTPQIIMQPAPAPPESAPLPADVGLVNDSCLRGVRNMHTQIHTLVIEPASQTSKFDRFAVHAFRCGDLICIGFACVTRNR